MDERIKEIEEAANKGYGVSLIEVRYLIDRVHEWERSYKDLEGCYREVTHELRALQGKKHKAELS